VTIEFHCPFCQKLLKTADDKAGVRANCPECGEAVTVPSPGGEAVQADPSFAVAGPAPSRAAASAAEVEDAAGPAGETKNCPMCGADIKRTANSCRFCGEVLVERPTYAPTQIQAGDIMSRTWQIYQKQLGLVIGSMLIMIAIWLAMGFVLYAGLTAVVISMIGPGARPGINPQQLTTMTYGATFVMMPLFIAVNAFFDGGFHLLRLRIARGEPAEVGDLFAGGRFFWRTLLANLAFGLVGSIGNILQIWMGGLGTAIGTVVHLVFLLIFWPCVYLIVDHDVGVVESFRRAVPLTSVNYPATIVLGMFALLLQMCGIMACCVGLIFSVPFMLLQFAVAYCRMSGQVVAAS
jgi:uncharacterized membrane protein/phage FluMu protein Com